MRGDSMHFLPLRIPYSGASWGRGVVHTHVWHQLLFEVVFHYVRHFFALLTVWRSVLQVSFTVYDYGSFGWLFVYWFEYWIGLLFNCLPSANFISGQLFVRLCIRLRGHMGGRHIF